MAEPNGGAQDSISSADIAIKSEKTYPDQHQPSVDMEQTSTSTSPQDAEKAEMPLANPWANAAAFPEGGAKAWLTVAGGSACLFVSFGWVNCIGVFQDYYSTNQLRSYSQSEISWIPALQSR
jgi:hypothetical protein